MQIQARAAPSGAFTDNRLVALQAHDFCSELGQKPLKIGRSVKLRRPF